MIRTTATFSSVCRVPTRGACGRPIIFTAENSTLRGRPASDVESFTGSSKARYGLGPFRVLKIEERVDLKNANQSENIDEK